MKLKNGSTIRKINEFYLLGMFTHDDLDPWIKKDFKFIIYTFNSETKKGNFLLTRE